MELPFACAVQTGTGHLQRETPCQDSAQGVCAENACCIALADGAGSRADSHRAAEAVTRALSLALARDFDSWYALPDDALARRLLTAATDAVRASAPGTEPACTLLLFAAARDGRCLMVHLGDGAILGAGTLGPVLLSGPENGESREVTYFVGSAGALQHLRVQRTLPAGCHTVLLCSDGSAAALLHEQTRQVAPAVSVLARMTVTLPRATAEQYMREDLDRLFRPHTPDDMSLAVLCLDPAAAD